MMTMTFICGVFTLFLILTRVVVQVLARAPARPCRRVRRRRLCAAGERPPPRRSPRIKHIERQRYLKIARHRFWALIINTKFDSDASDASDDSDQVWSHKTTTRVMSRAVLRVSGCPCAHTPFDAGTGLAEFHCHCRFCGDEFQAEYLGQWCDREDKLYS